jgi:hypothetical protein
MVCVVSQEYQANSVRDLSHALNLFAGAIVPAALEGYGVA